MDALLVQPIRVLYVKDDHNLDADSTDDAERDSVRSRSVEFWEAATALCETHDPLRPHEPCEDCLFELTLCTWFPEAAFQIASGRRFDLYVIDISAVAHPRNKLSWPEYEESVKLYGEMIKDADGTPIPHHLDITGAEILRLVANAVHTYEPLVAHYSQLTDLDEETALYCNLSHYGDKRELSRILRLAHSKTRQLVANGFSVRLPKEVLPGNNDAPVSIRFGGPGEAAMRVTIEPQREIFTDDGEIMRTGSSPFDATRTSNRAEPSTEVRVLRHWIRMANGGTGAVTETGKAKKLSHLLQPPIRIEKGEPNTPNWPMCSRGSTADLTNAESGGTGVPMPQLRRQSNLLGATCITGSL